MKAIFKGITFHVQSYDVNKEINKANYEYINSAGENEPLTQKPETLNLSGFVLSSLSRDLLLDAFKSNSPGTLIHPSLGVLKAVCTKLSIREDVDQNGAYYLSIEFIEISEAKVLGINTKEIKGAFLNKVQSFLGSISIIHEAVLLQSQVLDSVKMLNSFFTTRNGFGLVAHSIYDTVKNVYDFKYEVLSLINSPENLVKSLNDSINALSKKEKKELQPVVFGLIESTPNRIQKVIEASALILASSLEGKAQTEFIKDLRFVVSPEAYCLSYETPLKHKSKKEVIAFRPSLVAQYWNKDLDLAGEQTLFEVPIHG